FLNGIFTAQDRSDSAACALEARGREALAEMPVALAALPRTDVPLLPYAPMGVENLSRVFLDRVSGGLPTQPDGNYRRPDPHGADDLSLAALIDELEQMGPGVVMTMGKGGVGKTTIAAAIAIELAHRGHPVHLS